MDEEEEESWGCLGCRFTVEVGDESEERSLWDGVLFEESMAEEGLDW